MPPSQRVLSLSLLSCIVVMFHPARAQTLLGTVPTGAAPVALAVNSVTNKIFVANQGSNSVTVIDGASNGTATVMVGNSPVAVAVNPVTNRIYVANKGGNPTVSVIDGVTLATASVNTAGVTPLAIAVNPVTNRIYVANQTSNNVSVIDGAGNSVIATVATGVHPRSVAVNPVSNKIYVADMNDGSVTVIDGSTNTPTLVHTGAGDPYAVAVNAETNLIYVANLDGTVSVIDGGASNALLATVRVGAYPCAIAVNPVSNKIYVSDYGDGTVSVIDGASDSSTAVAVGDFPGPLAVAAMTNKIYVATDYGTLIMIDGVNDTVAGSAVVGYYPDAAVVDPASNIVYVANQQSYTVTVLAGAGSDPLQFVPVTPCRVADTRNPNGPFGGPPISGGTAREFAIPDSACGIPPGALGYSLNVAVVPSGPLGYLTVWPSGLDQPLISTMNSLDGRIKSNAAIVGAGAGGAISVFASNTTNVVLDINGYFAAASENTLAFYSLTPCRVVDTRWPNGPLGGPYLQGGAPGRDFPVLASDCNIPSSASAYSLNFAAVPHGPLGYLTTWPAGQDQPIVATLNALNGLTTANAAIVPAGAGGDIQVFVSNDSDVVIDINGYFAPAAPGGLSLYAAVPCRVLDTRNTIGAFVGTIGVNVARTPCEMTSMGAQAFVLSATVVPQGPLGYLTLWPNGWPQPTVSTLNAIDAAVTSNMAIVPTSNGWIDAFASNPTQLVLDSSSYFGP